MPFDSQQLETSLSKLKNYFVSHGQKQFFKRGDYLYHQNTFPDSLFYLQNGIVGLLSTHISGRDRLVRLFKASSFLSHRAILAEEPYHASAKVLEESTLLKISKQDFERILSEDLATARAFCKILAVDLGRAENTITQSNDSSVKTRVAESLVYLLEEFPSHLWTKQEIADFVGTATPTVFRALAEFESKGLIATQRREISELKRESLLKI